MSGYLYKFVLAGGDTIAGFNDSGEISGTGVDLYSVPILYDGTTTTLITLPPLGESTLPGLGFGGGINNDGDVVGTAVGLFSIQGFLYENGTLTTLPPPTAPVELPPALEAEFIATASLIVPGLAAAFQAETAAGGVPTSANFPTAINDSGTIVGFYFDDSGSPTQHGYIYDNGTYTALNDPLATAGTVPMAINDAGEIVGYYNDATGKHGFLYDNGTFTTIDDPLAPPGTTVLNGINDLGQIVGTYGPFGIGQRGFIYDNGTFTTFDPFNFITGETTTLNGINDKGQVTGTVTVVPGGVELSDGVLSAIAAPPGSAVAPAGINDNGDIVGFTSTGSDPFLQIGGVYTTISDPEANEFTNVTGINDSDEVVGTYLFDPPDSDFQGDFHGYLLSNGTYTTIDDPNGVGHGGTEVTNIDNDGDIVGYFFDASGDEHGFIDQNGIFTTVDDPNAHLLNQALDVNDSGDVVGSYEDSSGIAHGFIVSPTGNFTTIDDPLGVGGTYVTAINDSGEIAGSYTDASGANHLFIDINGQFTTIDLPAGFSPEVNAGESFGPPQIGLNDNGQLVFTIFGSLAGQPFIADPPPAAPTDLSLDASTDSGVQGDDITNVTQPEIDGQGTAGDTITLLDGTTTVGSATVGDDGSWQITTTTLGDGQHTLTATDTDSFGNTSDPSSALLLTIKTTAPAPTDLSLDPTTDSGIKGDDITTDRSPTIDGKGEVGDTVTLYNGVTAIGSGLVGDDGSWSITVGPLGNTFALFNATETDAAGNTSSFGSALEVTFVAAPAAPTDLSLDASTDSGVKGDDITNVTQPEIDGNGTAGDTITLLDGTTIVGTTTVGDDGSWQITTTTLGAGPHTLTATETDVYGDTSDPSSALSLTIDTNPPAAPTDLSLDPSTDDGQLGDDITSFTEPKIDGEGIAGDMVTLKDGSTTVGTAIVGNDGSWSITASALTLGGHVLTATETDAAGNISSASAPLDLIIVPPPTGPNGSDQFFYSSTNGQYVVGTGGNDTIWVNADNDIIDGLGGNDFLGGFGNGNHYDGGDGNDTIVSIGDSNSIVGGTGNDAIWGSGSNNTVSGGPGNDVIGYSGNGNSIDPGAGNNTIYLSGTDDTVTGGGGNNTIYLSGSGNTLTDGAAVLHDTVIGFDEAAGDRIHLTSDTSSDALHHTSLVNGTDTLIALSNGSTILLEGTSHVDASFFS